MVRNSLLIAIITLATLFAALNIIRWYAPKLLGIPVDLQMVQVSKEVVPFFDGVFRQEDYKEGGPMIIRDPYAHRARPLYQDVETMGPHDILGFRNRQIPNVADIITIGDSQTYGNNVPIEQTWPGQLKTALGCKSPVVYNMSVGGWGAVEYLEIFNKALLFKPKVVIVAFYTGNDPMDSFLKAYSDDHWDFLRTDASLVKSDTPPNPGFPPPDDELWKVDFTGSINFLFAPTLRLASNHPDYPSVAAGYEIILRVSELMQKIAVSEGIKLIFTIIPTTELVYSERVRKEQLQVPASYQKLVTSESRFIKLAENRLSQLDGVNYIDVLTSLQQAALLDVPLYPPNNGHPLAEGYAIIARSIAPLVDTYIDGPPRGMVAVPQPSRGESRFSVFLVSDQVQRLSNPVELMQANGWSENDLQIVTARDLATLPRGPSISKASPGKYNNKAVSKMISELHTNCKNIHTLN
ncbi:MAG: SGNH/GDSL hydrolase family protein [Gammaproteobacteria bacterium]|nr:MAG: SGNH/GDSL hydrolase family protein [Gammaproteobacteria bacterium]